MIVGAFFTLPIIAIVFLVSRNLLAGQTRRQNLIALGRSSSFDVIDEAAANSAAGFEETPIGYTWHHNENPGLMQLIEQNVHGSYPHSGGFSIFNNQ